MKITSSIVFGFLLCCAVFNCRASDYAEASELQKAGNQWKKGDPIPAGLLEYRTSREEGACFPNPRGTEMLFQSITNYFLFREIIFLPRLDAQVFSNVVKSAIAQFGPTRFFYDSMRMLAVQPELAGLDRFKAIQKQAAVKHIVVDSLYISYADMAPGAAKKVLDVITIELRKGKPWHDVYWKYMEAYECSYEDKAADGTVIKGTRSKIGNLGDFVLPQNRNPLFASREDWMPKGHTEKLFAAKAGDILILFDKEDLSRFRDLEGKETGERLVLYQIREVYEGKANN